MTEEAPVPEVPKFDLLGTLARWFTLKRDIAALSQQEGLMRKNIFSFAFPKPREGTNTYVLPDLYQLKGVHKINRNIDQAAMTVLGPKLKEANVNMEALIKWKPELSITAYKALTDEQRLIVDQFLVIKEGTPEVKVEPPSKKGVAGQPEAE